MVADQSRPQSAAQRTKARGTPVTPPVSLQVPTLTATPSQDKTDKNRLRKTASFKEKATSEAEAEFAFNSKLRRNSSQKETERADSRRKAYRMRSMPTQLSKTLDASSPLIQSMNSLDVPGSKELRLRNKSVDNYSMDSFKPRHGASKQLEPMRVDQTFRPRSGSLPTLQDASVSNARLAMHRLKLMPLSVERKTSDNT